MEIYILCLGLIYNKYNLEENYKVMMDMAIEYKTAKRKYQEITNLPL